MWQVVGCGLLLWAAFDLLGGHTYLHRAISRQQEPGLFWSIWMTYLTIAITLMMWG